MDREAWKEYYSEENLDFFGNEYELFRERQAAIEAEFAIQTLKLVPGARILDLCCGMGHNAVYLARRGFDIVGVDWSAPSLQRARALASSQRVDVVFHERDARDIDWESEFDAVVMLFNSFGYCEKEEDNLRILRNVARALKKDGRFLIEFANRDYAAHMAKNGPWRFEWKDSRQEVTYRLDPHRGRLHVLRDVSIGSQRKKTVFSQKVYTISELLFPLKEIGCTVVEMFGNYQGVPLGFDSSSLLVVGAKKTVA